MSGLASRRARLRQDDGVSLVELMITIFIISIVLSIIYGAFVTVMRTEKFTGDDSEALAELRLAVDRLTSELREARRIYVGSSASLLKFWVDNDRDDSQDPVERVTWEVRDVGGGKAQLVRFTDAAPLQPAPVASQFKIGTDTFLYDVTPPQTTVVTLHLTTDNQAGDPSGIRSVKTDIRLRNIK